MIWPSPAAHCAHGGKRDTRVYMTTQGAAPQQPRSIDRPRGKPVARATSIDPFQINGLTRHDDHTSLAPIPCRIRKPHRPRAAVGFLTIVINIDRPPSPRFHSTPTNHRHTRTRARRPASSCRCVCCGPPRQGTRRRPRVAAEPVRVTQRQPQRGDDLSASVLFNREGCDRLIDTI